MLAIIDSAVEHLSRFRFSLDPLIAEAKRRARQRRALVALSVLLLAGLAAGLTFAFGSRGGGSSGGHLGAFKGLSVAQHGQAGANVLPPRALAAINEGNAGQKRLIARAAKAGRHVSYGGYWLPATARLVGRAPDGTTFYGLSTTSGRLCIVEYIAPLDFSTWCVSPLSRSRPITLDASLSGVGRLSKILDAGGVAIDGVTSVSFTVLRGNTSSTCAWSDSPSCRAKRVGITVPVKNNVYHLSTHSSSSSIHGVVAHFGDGSTVKMSQCPLCLSGRPSGGTSQRQSS